MRFSLLILFFFFCSGLRAQGSGETAPRSKPVPALGSGEIALSPQPRALSLKIFKTIPILHQGRIKPLDSYARATLLRYSGKASFDRKPAINWLATALFNPEQTFDDKIFLINNPEVLEAISVKPDLHRRYSFNELKAGTAKLENYAKQSFEKEEKKRSELEKEFLRVFLNVYNYLGLVDSLQFFAQHPDFSTANSENSLFDILGLSKTLEAKISALSPSSTLREEDREFLALAFNLFTWVENHKAYKDFLSEEEPLMIIATKTGEPWISPWEALLNKENLFNQDLSLLKQIHQAYNQGDQKAFDESIIEFKSLVISKDSKYSPRKISLELLYNKINPFLWAKIFYGIAFLLGIILLASQNQFLTKISALLLYSGFALHFYGILSRILILERPPVTNLYETFVFVSFVMVLIGILIKYFDKTSSIANLLAAFSGLLLLLISSKFAAEGDTMQVLIAVLNSNFWLSTHVICVSLGYATVAFAGLIGHIYLIQKILKVNDIDLEKTYRLIYLVIGFGLAFSFLGTMLGGVWADQSWGRFWGWDPKENGALIIVLYCAALFHARMAGMVKAQGFAVGAALATMVVMTSWLGINLLGVGLHSYGFTSGLAKGLYAYYAFEIFFIVSTLIAINFRKGSSS